MEGVDLVVVIGQEFVVVDGVGDDLINIFGWFVFVVDFFVFVVGEFGGDQIDMVGDCVELVGDGMGGGDFVDNLIGDCLGVDCLGQYVCYFCCDDVSGMWYWGL